MSDAEFPRRIDIRQADGKEIRLEAGEAERAALARRFGLVRIDRLDAEVFLEREDRVVQATGRLIADFIQSCAVSSEDLPVTIDEEFSFRFVPEAGNRHPDEEVEIDAEDCDEIEYAGTSFDVGEAIAQTLALAIDPYATGPDADEARESSGMTTPEESSPFAALKGLTPKD